MVDAYDLLGLVPTYLLPPAEHWLREVEDNARARERPYSHPERAPDAEKYFAAESSIAPPPRPDQGKVNNGHARIDSVASDASATTVASASSTVSRAYSSASDGSLDDSASASDALPSPLAPTAAADPDLLFGDVWTHNEPLQGTTTSDARQASFAVPVESQEDYRRRRLRRVCPSTIRCRRCSADFAFTSQIISKGFTARHGPGYLVSPPPTNADHTLCAEYDSGADDDDDEDIGFGESDDEAFNKATRLRYDKRIRTNTKHDAYFRRQRQNNLPNIAVGAYQHRSLTTGLHVISDIVCCGCHAGIGWKYIDAREPEQKYKVGNFIIEMEKVFIFNSWEDVDAAAVAAVDVAPPQQMVATETTSDVESIHDDDIDDADSVASTNTDTDTGDDDNDDHDDVDHDDDEPVQDPADDEAAPPPQPSQPRLSFWASRFAGAFSLADTNPLASVRAFAALRHHENATRSDSVPPEPASDAVGIEHDVYESDVVDTMRSHILRGQDRAFDRMHQRRQAKLHRARGLFGRRQVESTYRIRERRNEISPPEIEFDSQDEDECDDLFAGMWDARTVAARRAEKARLAGL